MPAARAGVHISTRKSHSSAPADQRFHHRRKQNPDDKKCAESFLSSASVHSFLFLFFLRLHDPVSGVHQSKQEIPKQAFCFYDLFAVIKCVKGHDFVLFIHPCRLFRFLPMRFLLLSIAAYRSVVHVFKMKRLCPGGHSRVAL